MRMKASIFSARPVKFAKLSSSLEHTTSRQLVLLQRLLYERKMRVLKRQVGMTVLPGQRRRITRAISIKSFRPSSPLMISATT